RLEDRGGETSGGGAEGDGAGDVAASAQAACGDDAAEAEALDLQHAGGGRDAPVPQLVGEGALVGIDGAVGLDGDPAGAARAADVEVLDADSADPLGDGPRQAAAGLLDDDRDGQLLDEATQGVEAA